MRVELSSQSEGRKLQLLLCHCGKLDKAECICLLVGLIVFTALLCFAFHYLLFSILQMKEAAVGGCGVGCTTNGAQKKDRSL